MWEHTDMISRALAGTLVISKTKGKTVSTRKTLGNCRFFSCWNDVSLVSIKYQRRASNLLSAGLERSNWSEWILGQENFLMRLQSKKVLIKKCVMWPSKYSESKTTSSRSPMKKSFLLSEERNMSNALMKSVKVTYICGSVVPHLHSFYIQVILFSLEWGKSSSLYIHIYIKLSHMIIFPSSFNEVTYLLHSVWWSVLISAFSWPWMVIANSYKVEWKFNQSIASL